ncbi:hypothetical protein QWY93_01325 [Echinicola jeungdonensis]|uniref:Uncharacterized protein n=1 Tax=Echinicola jeungdonensis TaxID=709343 RepID=A0ABV5J2W6_9BACT|nr:hypothetical protein [Echinicola jeungdonensis]MDN3667983.1 hypothetical protein [Echinicola jeungdonensis]
MNLVYIYSINKYYIKVVEVISLFRDEFISEYIKPLLLDAYEKGCLRKELLIDFFIEIRFRNIDQHYLELSKVSPNTTLKECFVHLVAFQISGVCKVGFQQKYDELMSEVVG